MAAKPHISEKIKPFLKGGGGRADEEGGHEIDKNLETLWCPSQSEDVW